MPNSKNPIFSNYKLASLVQSGTDTLIVFYAPDNFGNLKRKRIKVNRIIADCPTKREATARLRQMCNDINDRLMAGWSPFYTAPEAPQEAVFALMDAVNIYKEEKHREVRKESYRTYSSFCNKFSAWLQKYDAKMLAPQFGKREAVMFMDAMYNTGINPRTYNNVLKLSRVLFSWLMEHSYTDKNPFSEIKTKKVYGKRRQLIPADDRQRIAEYLRQHDPEFLCYLHLICISLIRPKEIRELRIGDIRPAECRIVVPADVAKTHTERSSACPPDLIVELVKVMHIDVRPLNELLFYGHQKHYYDNRWNKVKKALGLPQEYQMYSFRDTGITDYLRSGMDNLTVMQLAGHTDLTTTSIYARHSDLSIFKNLDGKTPSF